MLLEPTEIYVKPVVELLRSEVDVHGLAHITSGGVGNLLRLAARSATRSTRRCRCRRSSSLIHERGDVSDEEMHEVFNMGCGFCVVVPESDEAAALELLRAHYPEAQPIGRAVAGPGSVRRLVGSGRSRLTGPAGSRARATPGTRSRSEQDTYVDQGL